MALIFLESFDKYGPANSNSAAIVSMLTAGEWTSLTGTTCQLVTGLSSPGYAFNSGNSLALAKTLSANYPRLIGGIRFSGTLVGQSVPMQFRDGATAQCSLTVETTGILALRTGGATGTILGSGATISANSTHYVEWDITFGATSAYQIWLDGVSLMSGTGNTRGGTANNYANAIAIVQAATGTSTVDDLYLFDSTSATNNAVLLNSPRVETTFPASDSAVQFALGAAILGSNAQRVITTSAPAANSLVLRRFTPAVSCTLNSITIMPAATSAAAQYRGVVYADSAGAPGTLMSSGSTVIGVTTGTAATLTLTSQSLVSGTQYWLGFMCDTGVTLQQSDGANSGYRAAATYASGAPSTAPAMTSGQASYLFWGNVSATGVNWYEAAQQPPPGAPSFVFDATVGHEDLYGFAPLSSTPAVIYGVAVKAYCQRSDSGAKTVSMRTKSGATDSAGSAAGQTPATTYGWLTSLFPTDPNTSAAWTGANLNAATSGFRVDS